MLREIEAVVPSKADADRAQQGPARSGAGRPAVVPIAIAGAMEVAAQLERHLAQCRRQRSAFALLWVSALRIDAGAGPVSAETERLVREEVAQRAFSRVRSTDLLLRESERDTCILLPGGSEAAALKVAARFLRALNGPYRVDDALFQVAVHIGHAACPASGAQGADLLARAMRRD
jgi:GGDEF domain-containing protein